MDMEKFLLDQFFNLKDFALAQVFEECQYAWCALARLEEFFAHVELGKIECEIPKGAVLVDPEKISIGKGTIVEPGAFIRGPCVIGENCEVRHGAYIRGFVLAGNGCIIGNSTEVKSSILLDGVCIAHFNYVGDSILGNRVNLGAGVKLANLRLDNQTIQISDAGQKISTNLKKLGAIIGDDAQFGCNAVTNPGTVVGKGVFCHPCMTIGGYIPPNAKVRSTQKMVIQDYVDRSCF
ncbi:MAG: Bifunctional protein GlmU [Chlamydiae bacterium]|nr:Bifunctional protein GlmU [Chlamydiota bacterium]